MIEPRYGTLQNLFSDRVFRIPHFQRFYSWRRKQRDDLFADIRRLADRAGDDHHFMATIVCHRTDELKPIGSKEYRLYDVVDGQQRITTLIIILKCIQLELDEGSDERDELAKLLVKPDGHLILLQTNNVNEHIFNAFIRNGTRPRREDLLTHADKNLRDAITQCSEFVTRWREDRGDLISLLRLIKNRLGFVTYDTEDSHIVYSVFEVLNSRGLIVDWLDKCKSLLMERTYEHATSATAKQAAIDELQNLWSNIYREIAQANVSGEVILRVAATLQHGPSRGKQRSAEDALEVFRAECDDADKPRQIAESIFDVTKKLVTLEKNIFLGPVTKILHARILAIALMSTDSLDDRERDRALDQWERVTFRIFELYGKDSRYKVGEYIRLATNIINNAEGASRYSEIMQSLRELGHDYPIESAVVEGLDGKACYEDLDFCRYVLWRYEEHLASQSGQHATVDEQVRREIWEQRASDSIEHVFPQNPEPGGAWDGKMVDEEGNESAHRHHVDRMGNLILLPQALNEEAKRQGFTAKRRIYERHHLRMIEEVAAEDDWTLSEIDAREQRIMGWARHQWADLTMD